MSCILHVVECLGDVESCLAEQCCKALHLNRYVLLAFLSLAMVGNELYYASVKGGAVVVPYALIHLLCSAADDVQQVDGKDIVL